MPVSARRMGFRSGPAVGNGAGGRASGEGAGPPTVGRAYAAGEVPGRNRLRRRLVGMRRIGCFREATGGWYRRSAGASGQCADEGWCGPVRSLLGGRWGRPGRRAEHGRAGSGRDTRVCGPGYADARLSGRACSAAGASAEKQQRRTPLSDAAPHGRYRPKAIAVAGRSCRPRPCSCRCAA